MKPHPIWLGPVAAFVMGWILSSGDPRADARAKEVEIGRESSMAVGGSGPSEGPGAGIVEPGGGRTAGRREARMPLVSLRETLNYPSALHRLAAFARLADTMNAGELAALYRELQAQGPSVEGMIWQYFFRRWTNLAPEIAVAAASPDHVGMVLLAWGRLNPKAALKWFDEHVSDMTLEMSGMRSQLLGAVMPKPGQMPPEEALREMLKFRVSKREEIQVIENGILAIMHDWARKDPEAAWQGALAVNPAEPTRKRALTGVIYALAGTNLERARQWLEQMPEGPERAELTGNFASSLARSAGTNAAREYAFGLPDGETRRKALGGVVSVMQQREPTAVDAFLSSLSPADLRDPGPFAEAWGMWFRRDPSRAGEALLATLTPDFQPTEEQWSSYRRLFTWWQVRSPKMAAEYLAKLPASLRSEPLNSAVLGLVMTDAPAAAKWALERPDAASRSEVTAIVARKWGDRNIKEAAQWLNGLPPGPERGAAVEGFVENFVSTNPDDALMWLRTIPDEKERVERLNRVWQKWSDREAAVRWRDSAEGLSAAERAGLR